MIAVASHTKTDNPPIGLSVQMIRVDGAVLAYVITSRGGEQLVVVEEILRAKLAQHPEAQEALRDSGDEEIVEDSPTDYFWGAGADGSGQNMLGKTWMKIRAE